VWDWTKLPGTTAIQGTLETGEKNPIAARGITAFVGGVSDGAYGIAAMELGRGKLSGKKAWFFFDDSYLCLGAGISLADDKEHGVATDVNQTLLVGDVFTSQSQQPITTGIHSYRPGEIGWVHHNHVGYVLGRESRLSLSVGSQTGKWSDIGTGPDETVALPVFNLWIDHGHSPDDRTYQYIVLPGASVKQTAARATKPVIHVLSNSRDIQAAWNDSNKVAMSAFYRPGSLATPIGRISVDQPCLLMLEEAADGWKITVANPENQQLSVKVQIENAIRTLELSGGERAGSSITALLPR
jgi:chondroitin AC lyase